MNAIVVAMPGNEDLARNIAVMTDAELGRLEYRKFPDRDSYLRFTTDIRARQVVLACSLHDPDSKVNAGQSLHDVGGARRRCNGARRGFRDQQSRSGNDRHNDHAGTVAR